MDWNQWFRAVEPTLRSGGEVIVPDGMPAPSEVGFVRTLGEPMGQVKDWAYAMPDGSRIHLHEMKDGVLVAHLDVIDPGRGPVRALRHWATESASGRAALFSTALWIVLKLGAR
jgi:hypothetical protein